MNNFDPRIETILSYVRKIWFICPDLIKSFVWLLLKGFYKTYKRFFVFKKLDKPVNLKSKADGADETEIPKRVIAKAPSDTDWNELLFKRKDIEQVHAHTAVVDIIVPIYDGYDETMRCIYSVLNSKTYCLYEIILINDKSPNERLSKDLAKLAQDFSCIKLITNETNLGFVKSTNKGMFFHRDRDVVWLNSDTEVFDFWLDRIIAIAYTKKEIATVTPLSNNATICSYPIDNKDNFSHLEISDRDLDKLASEINKDAHVEAPTGVGFCMFIKRDALIENGFLNEEAFGKGYGEENDLCQRFKEAGWINVITPSVFVRHYGATSFKSESLQRQSDAYQMVLKLHPEYDSQIKIWSRLSPLSMYRLRLDISRYLIAKDIKLGETSRRILIITHDLGGVRNFLLKHFVKK